jgi:hypothetical protein
MAVHADLPIAAGHLCAGVDEDRCLDAEPGRLGSEHRCGVPLQGMDENAWTAVESAAQIAYESTPF